MRTTLLPIGYFHRRRELEGLIGEGAETVEPILDSFGGYSTDNLSNFYYPYIIVLLMVFRDEVSHHFDYVVDLINPAVLVAVCRIHCSGSIFQYVPNAQRVHCNYRPIRIFLYSERSATGGPSIPLRHSSAGYGILPIFRARHHIFPAVRRCFHSWRPGALPRLENLRLPGKSASV